MDTSVKRRITAGLAAVLGAFLIACESDPRQPGHNPEQAAPKADPVLTLTTFVPTKCSPYTATVSIDGRGRIAEPTIPVASGTWTHDISYASGKRLTVTLGVFATKKDCGDAYCQIDDGPGNVLKKPMILGVGSAVCQYTTRR